MIHSMEVPQVSAYCICLQNWFSLQNRGTLLKEQIRFAILAVDLRDEPKLCKDVEEISESCDVCPFVASLHEGISSFFQYIFVLVSHL